MMMFVFVRRDRGTNRRAQRTTENRTIPTTEFIPDGRPAGTANAATDGRIQGRAVRVDVNGKDNSYKHQVFRIHDDPLDLSPR